MSMPWLGDTSFFQRPQRSLEEVAKSCAARRLARIMRSGRPRAPPGNCVSRPDGSATLTAQQPENNVVRVTVQARRLGWGAEPAHEFAGRSAVAAHREQRIAPRTQQILAHESGVAGTIDPLAGAYAIEAPTSRLESEAEAC
jgi:methylmalonyl-CoA mutase N-terminal domain/subunit